jgi:D-tyrosyl-tRNA(Tyr) deacylase
MNTTTINIVLVTSTTDVASMNVFEQLKKQNWQQASQQFHNYPIYTQKFSNVAATLITTDKRSINCEHIDEELKSIVEKIDAIIFITKHDSKSGRPSFSVHTQGNWSTADLGGIQYDIANCPVILKHTLYLELRKNNTLSEFEVVNECTHHGPSLKTPSMFIEIGSKLEQWQRQDAGQIMTLSIIAGLNKYTGENNPKNKPIIVGLGGTHTCSNYARLIDEDKAILSHVCPEYAIDGLTKEMISQAIQKSTIKPILIIDWKGMSGSQRVNVLKMLEELNQPYVKLNELKNQLDSKTN